ncbi:hypothetical protein LCGC14_0525760 [marine sediment metagenome]|uniref:Helicase HerA central domain-containing protein n=1 Tax=marine sediment metagenome TaxID=412755 RepID=A0A0F9V5A3_9ZZZZ|nr:DUF87 domain-containing protein [bacterium]
MSKINTNKIQNEDYSKIDIIIRELTSIFDDNIFYNVRQVRKKKSHIIDKLERSIPRQYINRIVNIFLKNLPKKIYHGEILGYQLKRYIEKKFNKFLSEIFKCGDSKVKDDIYNEKEGNFNKMRNNANEHPTKKDDLNQKHLLETSDDITLYDGQPLGNFSNASRISQNPKYFPLSIIRNDEIGRISPNSNTKVAKCTITDNYQEHPYLNGMYVTFNAFPGNKTLGRILNIHTLNSTPSKLLKASLINNETNQDILNIIRDVDARVGDIYIDKVLFKGKFYKELGNAPPTGIPVYEATEKDIKEFYCKPTDNAIQFVRINKRLGFIPDFDLKQIITQHIYIIGKTGAGKGLLANAFMASIVRRNLEIAPGEERNIPCLYFDYTGQFANDAYGYFAALESICGEDPRVVVEANTIGIQNEEDLIEIFCRKYRILDLGWDPRKLGSIQRHLNSRITIDSTFQDFLNELPNAIRTAYSGNAQNHVQKLQDHLCCLGDTIWNTEIEPLKSPTLFNQLVEHLRNGKFVIINLSSLRNSEYKPGTVYRILKFVHEFLNDNFTRTQREMDFPVIVGIDEAQNFAPNTTKLHSGYYLEECNSLISQLCAEDRKTGLCMLLITQRLSWINRNVLANIGAWFVSKINYVDLDNLKKELGTYDFVHFKKWNFHIFGDISSIQKFPTIALKPEKLAELKNEDY